MGKKIKEHPHDALIHKLEDCMEDFLKLCEKFNVNEDESYDAYSSIESAIDDVRAMDI